MKTAAVQRTSSCLSVTILKTIRSMFNWNVYIFLIFCLYLFCRFTFADRSCVFQRLKLLIVSLVRKGEARIRVQFNTDVSWRVELEDVCSPCQRNTYCFVWIIKLEYPPGFLSLSWSLVQHEEWGRCLLCSIYLHSGKKWRWSLLHSDRWQWRQSGFKSGGRGSGFENWGSWVLKVQQMEVRNTWLRVSSAKFLFKLYTNYSISEKSPLWKVFSSRIPVCYRI